MKRYDLIIVGAGPSGLSAAIEAAKRGLKVVVFDENEKPGGQLFKQIHKFFGSKEHKAKIRGFVIGEQLLEEADKLGVEVVLNATVIGLYQDKEITVRIGEAVYHYKGDAIVVATGAAENMVTFPGWTLPGVIGAGAAQTMMNLHGVKPGKKILMLGSGNVGLVVSFQLMQCGCEVVALVDAAPRVGGYGVHAAKVARTGVPFYLSHTIVKAEGEDYVTGVTIAEVDSHFRFVPGTNISMWIRYALLLDSLQCHSFLRWQAARWRIIQSAAVRFLFVTNMGELLYQACLLQEMYLALRKQVQP